MTPLEVAEWLGRRKMGLSRVEPVSVRQLGNSDRYIVKAHATGQLYFIDGIVVAEIMNDARLHSIHQQVQQEQRGWLLFEGWAPKPRVRKPEKMTPPEYRKFVQEYPPQ